MQHQQQLGEQGSGLHLGAPQFEPVGIDPMPFDYPSQFVPSMDSPNVNIDYKPATGGDFSGGNGGGGGELSNKHSRNMVTQV